MDKVDTKVRNSSIELLKIIGMILIVLSHAVPCYGDKSAISYIDVNLATDNISEFILIVFRNLGQIGNIIFIMCSAYFLIDSKNAKTKKILCIVFDCFIISIIYLVIYLFFYKLSAMEIIRQIFPITFVRNWFVSCYLMLYIIHPVLNKIIHSTDKSELLKINIFLIATYCIASWILGGKYYYNELIGFIVIYFLVAYNKLYLKNFSKNKKINLILLTISLFLFVGILVITNILGLNINIFRDKMLYWNGIDNIFGIIIALTMLNIFKNKYFENKIINYLSSVSLLFYIIHENNLFKVYTKPLFYQYVFPFGHILIWVLLEALLLFLYGIILGIIYKETIQKLLDKIIIKLNYMLCKIYSKMQTILLKLN